MLKKNKLPARTNSSREFVKQVLRAAFEPAEGVGVNGEAIVAVGEGFPLPQFSTFRLVEIPHARPKEVLARTCFLVAGDVLDQILCVAADADCSL